MRFVLCPNRDGICIISQLQNPPKLNQTTTMRTTTSVNVSKEQRDLLRSASAPAQRAKEGLRRKRRDIKRNRQRGRRHDREVKEDTNEHFLTASQEGVLEFDCMQPEPVHCMDLNRDWWNACQIDDWFYEGTLPPLEDRVICEW